MRPFAERADTLSDLVAAAELDLLIVSNLVNVRYLTGFSGTNGIVVIGPGGQAPVRVFGTDFRYYERVRPELTEYEVRRAQADILEIPAQVVDGHRPKGESAREKLVVGFDDAHLTVRAHKRLAELLGDAAELVPAAGLVEHLRAVKGPDEVTLMRRAAAIAAELYEWLSSDYGLAGRTEREVALALEIRAKELGADGLSFPPIIAAAANGALPHAEPGDVEIPRDALVIVDLGCIVEGYCSDCTRTFATGSLEEEAVSVYRLVQEAQSAALAGVRAGAECREVDAIARRMIEEAGYGEQFGHGLGHGVGLEVHEEPRLTPRAEGELVEGNAVTVEPGVYVTGRFGVRIEDLVIVTEDGCEILTPTSKDLVVAVS
jgi:Xaa-Pro aminopeptidase